MPARQGYWSSSARPARWQPLGPEEAFVAVYQGQPEERLPGYAYLRRVAGCWKLELVRSGPGKNVDRPAGWWLLPPHLLDRMEAERWAAHILAGVGWTVGCIWSANES